MNGLRTNVDQNFIAAQITMVDIHKKSQKVHRGVSVSDRVLSKFAGGLRHLPLDESFFARRKVTAKNILLNYCKLFLKPDCYRE